MPHHYIQGLTFLIKSIHFMLGLAYIFIHSITSGNILSPSIILIGSDYASPINLRRYSFMLSGIESLLYRAVCVKLISYSPMLGNTIVGEVKENSLNILKLQRN